jgi:hypothetical protein
MTKTSSISKFDGTDPINKLPRNFKLLSTKDNKKMSASSQMLLPQFSLPVLKKEIDDKVKIKRNSLLRANLLSRNT